MRRLSVCKIGGLVVVVTKIKLGWLCMCAVVSVAFIKRVAKTTKEQHVTHAQKP